MADEEDIRLLDGVVIPYRELVFEFSRGGGPGGQNVNKVNSRVSLRFDLAGSPSLTPPVRARLQQKLASRLTQAGELVLHASEHRDRERNRQAAIGRFRNLLVEALRRPKARRPTRRTRGSVERRIQAAKRRGQIKRLRRPPGADD